MKFKTVIPRSGALLTLSISQFNNNNREWKKEEITNYQQSI